MSEDLKHKTKIGMYWTFLNQGATQLMQFFVGIVMARLLSPEDFGISALPAVFMAVAGIFIDSGFGQALVRKEEVTEKDLATSFYYALGMGVFIYLILFFTAPWIADFYNTPILTPLIRVTALNFIWGPLDTPQSVILHRRLDFKTPARISIINKIVGAAVGITAAYNGLGVWALVISGLVSSILGLIQTWWVVKWLPKEPFDKESFRYLWNFGNKIIGVNLIDTLYNNVAPVIIGKFYSPTELGVFNRADGYARLPARQITGLIENVSFPVLSRMQADDEFLARNYRRMIKVSAFIAFPIFMLLIALARPLIILMVTEKWEASIVLLQIICFERMLWPVQCLNKNLLQVKGRSDLALKVEIIKKPTILLFIVAALPFGLKAYCFSILAAGVFSLIINTHYTGKLINLNLFRQLRDIAPSFLLALVMLSSIFATTYFIDNLFLQVIVGGLVGSGIYIAGAYFFKFDELNDVKYMFNRKK